MRPTSLAHLALALSSSLLVPGDVAAQMAPEEAPLGPPAAELRLDDVGQRAAAGLGVALQLIQAQRYAEARNVLRQIMTEQPDLVHPYFYAGMTYYLESRWALARTHFERALQLAPDLDQAHLFTGWCLLYLGSLEPARSHFEVYLERDPTSADAIFALGLIDLDEDRIDSARKRFERAIELARAGGLADREAVMQSRMADLLVRTGELEQARTALARALTLDPTSSRSFFKLSHVLQLLGDAEGAEMARGEDAAVLERIAGADAE